MLLGMIKNGCLPHGALSDVAKKFSVTKQTTWLLWKKFRAHIVSIHNNGNDNNDDDNNIAYHQIDFQNTAIQQFFETNLHERRDGKLKYNRDELQQYIKSIPRKKRRTYRHLSKRFGIPIATVWRMTKKESVFKRHTSSLKPYLTEENMVARIDYAMTKVDTTTRYSQRRNDESMSPFRFFEMYDEVHIDEKWFFLCQDGETYILAPDEEPPQRMVKHKGYITKVMFLCAMARPRWCCKEKKWWDGKIGIFPIGKYTSAKRTTKNQRRGDQIWENETVNKDVYRKILMDQVVPAIMESWPQTDWNDPNFVIKVQQDGAKSHIGENDEHWLEYLEDLGLHNKIKLYTQPANSPDTNINDLGFFVSLQSRYYDFSPENAMQIIDMVKQAFDEYPPELINRIWLSLQQNINSILENRGSNLYSQQHMKKEKKEKEGTLPRTLKVTKALKLYLDY